MLEEFVTFFPSLNKCSCSARIGHSVWLLDACIIIGGFVCLKLYRLATFGLMIKNLVDRQPFILILNLIALFLPVRV